MEAAVLHGIDSPTQGRIPVLVSVDKLIRLAAITLLEVGLVCWSITISILLVRVC